MILTVVQLMVRPEVSDSFNYHMRDYTRQTRAQAGNLWCQWSRNVEDPDEFLLLQAFDTVEHAVEHAGTDYFKTMMRDLPNHLTQPPRAINTDTPGTGWTTFAELPFFVHQPAHPDTLLI